MNLEKRLTKPSITQYRLKEWVYYNPETGDFTWKQVAERQTVNKVGDFIRKLSHPKEPSKCYYYIALEGVTYPAHRLAFLYMRGRLPIEVNHIDKNLLNNKWNNLREVTHTEAHYTAKLPANNKIGVKGLRKRKYDYIVQVTKDKIVHTQTFRFTAYKDCNEAKQAALAYLKAMRQELHGEFTNHGSLTT